MSSYQSSVISHLRTRIYLSVFVSCVVLACGAVAQDAEPGPAEAPANIPIHAIRKLYKTYATATPGQSERKRVRTFMGIIQAGRELEKTYPGATNIVELWAVMMRSAQETAILEASDEHSKVLIKIAEKLATSSALPAIRIQADLVVTHAKLSALDEDNVREERKLNREFVERYRGIENREVEAKALMCGMLMAFDADDGRALSGYRKVLSKSFSDVPGVAGFMRDRFGRYLNVGRLFRGRFRTLDGEILVAPLDLMGRKNFLYFWDHKVYSMEHKLSDIKKLYQSPNSTDVTLIGINLNEDVEGAKRFCRLHGLNGMQVVAPGGRKNDAYSRFGTSDQPSYCLVGSAGRVKSDSIAGLHKLKGRNLGGNMVTFLLSGECLVTEPFGPTDMNNPPEASLSENYKVGGELIPEYLLDDLQSLFLIPPERYTESMSSSIARYEAALALGREMLDKHPNAGNAFLVRNRILTALEGLVILTSDTAKKKEALALAAEISESRIPSGAKLLADIILAKQKLRKQSDLADLKKSIAAFAEKYADTDAYDIARAYAVLFALCMGEEDMFDEMIGKFMQDKRIYDDWRVRRMLRIFGFRPDEGRPLDLELTRLDGTTLKLPEDLNGKFGVVCFVTPPKRTPGRSGNYDRAMGSFLATIWSISKLHEQYSDDAEMIFVMLCESREQVQRLVDSGDITCEVAFSGDGFADEAAQKFSPWGKWWPSVYSMLVSRDGLIVRDLRPPSNWHDASGFGRAPDLHAAFDAMMKAYYRTEGEKALDGGDYAGADRLFSELLKCKLNWRIEARLIHGMRSEARVKLKNWQGALQDIDKVLDKAKLGAGHYPMLMNKAEALDALGQSAKAAATRKQAEIFEKDYEKTEQIRANTIPKWNMIGVYPLGQSDMKEKSKNAQWKSFDEVTALEKKVDLDRPFVYRGSWPSWCVIQADHAGCVNMWDHWRRRNVLVFAVSYVYSPDARICKTLFRVDDYGKMYVNGKFVAKSSSSNFDLELKEGWNEILLKCANLAGAFSLQLTLDNKDGALKHALRPKE